MSAGESCGNYRPDFLFSLMHLMFLRLFWSERKINKAREWFNRLVSTCLTSITSFFIRKLRSMLVETLLSTGIL